MNGALRVADQTLEETCFMMNHFDDPEPGIMMVLLSELGAMRTFQTL